MLQITKQISNYNHSAGNDIKYIVVHDTGNINDTAKGNANYFYTGDRQSSAHYFVDENSIYQVVEENQGAWHCGDGGMKYGIGNHNSIGIEMCITNGAIADETINNTIDLVKMLMSKHNISLDHVVRHYDASRKNCPSHMSANNWSKWNDFKSRLNGQTSSQSIVNNIGGDYMSKKYQNGSTPEPVFADSNLSIKVGSLDPWESCEAIADSNGKIVVLYNTPAGKKAGFVAYRGGL